MTKVTVNVDGPVQAFSFTCEDEAIAAIHQPGQLRFVDLDGTIRIFPLAHVVCITYQNVTPKGDSGVKSAGGKA